MQISCSLRRIGNCFPWRWEEHHIKSEVVWQFILQKLSDNLKGWPCRSWQHLVQVIGPSDSLHFWPCLLFSVCSISLTKFDYMHQLCFLYMLNYPAVYSLSERQSGFTHARNCVYLSKIENSSYYQELVSHPLTESVDELSSSVWIKLQRPFPGSY